MYIRNANSFLVHDSLYFYFSNSSTGDSLFQVFPSFFSILFTKCLSLYVLYTISSSLQLFSALIHSKLHTSSILTLSIHNIFSSPLQHRVWKASISTLIIMHVFLHRKVLLDSLKRFSSLETNCVFRHKKIFIYIKCLFCLCY